MYRDAIVHDDESEIIHKIVVAAYLITPKLGDAVGRWQDADSQGRLFHPEYRQKFRFGAFTLKPGGAVEEAQRVLDRIMTDAAVE